MGNNKLPVVVVRSCAVYWERRCGGLSWRSALQLDLEGQENQMYAQQIASGKRIHPHLKKFDLKYLFPNMKRGK